MYFSAPQAITNPIIQVHPNNSVTIEFTPPDDPENPGKKVKDFVIQYTTDEEPDDESVWKELKFTDPDDTDDTTIVSIDGENFNPDTKYNTRIIARGEIDSQPNEPTLFATGDGVIAPSQPSFNVDTEDGVIRVPAGTDYTIKCVSEGYPAPDVRWVDSHGNVSLLLFSFTCFHFYYYFSNYLMDHFFVSSIFVRPSMQNVLLKTVEDSRKPI